MNIIWDGVTAFSFTVYLAQHFNKGIWRNEDFWSKQFPFLLLLEYRMGTAVLFLFVRLLANTLLD
jgi:hypothetical protein